MAELYLIRNGHTQPTQQVTDPYSAGLTAEGLAQARALAHACAGWDIQYLGVSTTLHSQETADIIHARLPQTMRRDMQDLEDVTLDDLNLDPTASHRLETWSPDQRRAALRQAWTRVTAALARVLLYCEHNALERIALVAGEAVLQLVLLSYLGLDWRVDEHLTIALDPGSVTRIALKPDDRVRVDWVNRTPQDA
jgi:broad specificity phosphatase PhoE